MREIKFRLRQNNKIVGYERWNKRNEYCLPGWEYSSWQDGIWIHEDNAGWIEHDNKDLYTGLKDKDGTEIYEGDIILISPNEHRHIVRYHEQLASFVLSLKSEPWMTFMDWQQHKRYKVIGNIYEDPELLEEDKP